MSRGRPSLGLGAGLTAALDWADSVSVRQTINQTGGCGRSQVPPPDWSLAPSALVHLHLAPYFAYLRFLIRCFRLTSQWTV